MLSNHADDRGAFVVLQRAAGEAGGDGLVAADPGVRRAVGADVVGQAAFRAVQKSHAEAGPGAIGLVGVAVGRCGVDVAKPFGQAGQRAKPKRVDLDALARPGGEHVAAVGGVHPGELGVVVAGGDQAVGVHGDRDVAAVVAVSVRAREVRIGHAADGVQHPAFDRLARGVAGVGVEQRGVGEPHRAVHGVVVGFAVLVVVEAVGHHAVAQRVGEGAQRGGGGVAAAGRDEQPGQSDEGVPAPVGEPRIAGDDAAARFGVGVRAPRDDEVGRGPGEHVGVRHAGLGEGGGDRGAVVGGRLGHGPGEADVQFGGAAAGFKVPGEAAGHEQVFGVVLPAVGLAGVAEVAPHVGGGGVVGPGGGQLGDVAVAGHAERGVVRRGRSGFKGVGAQAAVQPVEVAQGQQRVDGQRGPVVEADDRPPQRRPAAATVQGERADDADRAEGVRPGDRVAPDAPGEVAVARRHGDVAGGGVVTAVAGEERGGQLHGRVRRVARAVQRECVDHLAEHHHASHRRRRRGDQQAVVPPRVAPEGRAHGVAAGAVGPQPLGVAEGGDAGVPGQGLLAFGRGRGRAAARPRGLVRRGGGGLGRGCLAGEDHRGEPTHLSAALAAWLLVFGVQRSTSRDREEATLR